MTLQRTSVWLGALAAAVLLLAAGCPLATTTDSTTRTVPAGSGRASSGADSGVVGPPAPTQSSGATGASGTATDASGPTAIGANSSSAATIPDALSVQFPDCDEPGEAAFWRAEILRLVNQARVAQKLSPVTWNNTLADQAAQYACELIHYDFFSHVNEATGSHLRDRAAQFGYEYWIIGENLAAGQQSPAEAVQAWLASPCHRENVLNPAFTELGVGIRFGGDYGYYWVQEFGRSYTLEPYSGPPYKDPACNSSE